MNPEIPGIAALNRYLSGGWNFDQLYDWAITYGDTDERRNDEPSMSIAAQVMMWIFEMSDGLHTQQTFDAKVASLARAPYEVLARAS